MRVSLLAWCAALVWLSLAVSKVRCLVFESIAPSIVSVTSPSCAGSVETNTTRLATLCPSALSTVTFQLKGIDWNGILEVPQLFLLTPLNNEFDFNCELDNDFGVVTVGHEAWEVSCRLRYNLLWWDLQGPLGLQMWDYPFVQPSEIVYGLTTNTPAQPASSNGRATLLSILGCQFDCRLNDSITVTGINFGAASYVRLQRVGSSTFYNLRNIAPPTATSIVAQLPSTIAVADLDSNLQVSVYNSTGALSVNWGYIVIEGQYFQPLVLAVSGCTNDLRARTTSQCRVGSTVTIVGRGFTFDWLGAVPVLVSPVGATYTCPSYTLTNLDGSSSPDSFTATCALPAPLTSGESYSRWQVGLRSREGELSDLYYGLSYAIVGSTSATAPIVHRVYCTSGCFSGDVLAVEGTRLAFPAVVQLKSPAGVLYSCYVVTQSDTRLTCVLPRVPGSDAGLLMNVVVTSGASYSDKGLLTLTSAPLAPRITAVFGCTQRSAMSVQNCSTSVGLPLIVIRSEGWPADVDWTEPQIVVITPTGREVACAFWSSNFTQLGGVLYTTCYLPLITWQETWLPHSLAVATRDEYDTWYWTTTANNAVQFNPQPTPANSATLPAVYGITPLCQPVNNVSYCNSGDLVYVTGVRLTDPVTAVLANTYTVRCYQMTVGVLVVCPLPTIRPVDVGLVLEVDIYAGANNARALTSNPPILTYAATSPFTSSGVPNPGAPASSTGGGGGGGVTAVSSTAASTAAARSSSSTAPARPSSSSSSLALLRSSSSSAASATSSTRSSASSVSSATSSRAGSSSSSARVTAPSSSSSSSRVVAPSVTSSSSSTPVTATSRPSSASSSSSTAAPRTASSSSSTTPPVRSSTAGSSSGVSSSSSSSGIDGGGGSSSSSSSSPSILASSSSSSSNSSGSDDTPSAPESESASGLSGGAVAGIVVVVLVVVLCGCVGGLFVMYNGCPSFLRRSRRGGPMSVDAYLNNMGDSSMGASLFSGEASSGYVPPNYAAHSVAADAAASYQPPNARSGGAAASVTDNPYLPPSMRSSMLSASHASSDSAAAGQYLPPNASRRMFDHSSSVHGSVDNTDGHGGHTSDDY